MKRLPLAICVFFALVSVGAAVCLCVGRWDDPTSSWRLACLLTIIGAAPLGAVIGASVNSWAKRQALPLRYRLISGICSGVCLVVLLGFALWFLSRWFQR